ncbi:MAG: CHAT domain-containing protein, partial [Alphaproteobacteria bacterium]|nr:CHAT domain-containing protein [Alphaproteobacteria bacterium]
RMNLAALAEETGNAAEAMQEYRSALAELPANIAPNLSAEILDNLGRLEGHAGLFNPGESAQRKAAELYAREGNCDGVRRALSILGSILIEVGSTEDAEAYLSAALQRDCQSLIFLSEPAAQKADLTWAGDRASRAQSNAPHPAAVDSCRRIPHLPESADAALFRALIALSDAASLAGDAQSSFKCLQAAHAYISTPRRALRLANALGSYFLDQDDALQARQWFTRALVDADQAELPLTHEGRGVAHLGLAQSALQSRDLTAAADQAARALKLACARGDAGQIISALRTIAAAQLARGEHAVALRALQLAAALIERVPIGELDAETRATYLATQHGVFEELIDLLIASAGEDTAHANANAVWQALTESERGRSRALQYARNQTDENVETLGAYAGKQSSAYQEMLQRLALTSAAAGPETNWEAALAALEQTLSPSQASHDVLSADRFLAELKRLDATFIEFASGRELMYAFICDESGVHVVKLGKRAAINGAATALSTLLRASESAATDVALSARRVAELVLWPLSARLGHKRLLIAPEEMLHFIPFAILPWAQQQKGLVLHQVELAMVPSAFFLTARNPPPRSGKPSFELFGDPVFGLTRWRLDCFRPRTQPPVGESLSVRSVAQWSDSLPPLPASRSEVLGIEALARRSWPSVAVAVHLGCAATAQALRQAETHHADVLHIATHGFVDARRPRLSALILTRESAEISGNGIFSLFDMLATANPARIVVLSACDTSAGR